MAHQAKRTAARDALFFDALQKGIAVHAACLASGYQHSAVYRWRKQHQAFADLWNDAQIVAADLLEEEADRRARDGYDETTTRSDGVQTVKNKRSDMLLLARLKALRPERYREGGGPQDLRNVKIEFVVRNHLLELTERMAKEAEKAAERDTIK